MRWVAILLAVSVVGAGETTAKDTVNERIPDPDYHAKRGDRATVAFYMPTTCQLSVFPIAVSERANREFGAAAQIKDQDGMDELIKAGEVFSIPIGTPVLVLSIEPPPEGEPLPVAIVRILDGEHKSKKGWTAARAVVRLIPNPDYDSSKRMAQKRKIVPDPNYQPQTGDVAELYGVDHRGELPYVICAKKLSDYLIYLERSRQGKSIEDLLGEKRLVKADIGASVEIQDVAGTGSSPFHADEIGRVLGVTLRGDSKFAGRVYVLEQYVKRPKRAPSSQ